MKFLIIPIEENLQEQEEFAQRAEQARLKAIALERTETLVGLGVDPLHYNLSMLTAEGFETLVDSINTAAKDKAEREKAERQADREKADRLKAQAERELEWAKEERAKAAKAVREAAESAAAERAKEDKAKAERSSALLEKADTVLYHGPNSSETSTVLDRTVLYGDDRSFTEWWDNVGSGYRPEPGHDYEEHAHRIAQMAWSRATVVASIAKL